MVLHGHRNFSLDLLVNSEELAIAILKHACCTNFAPKNHTKFDDSMVFQLFETIKLLKFS